MGYGVCLHCRCDVCEFKIIFCFCFVLVMTNSVKYRVHQVRFSGICNDIPIIFLISFKDAKISKRVSHSAALNVIKTHRSNKIITENIQKSSIGTNKAVNCDASPATGPINNDLPEVTDEQSTEQSDNSTSDARPKYRQIHAYPGRPQLLRLSSNLSRDVEYESKIEKFQILLEAPMLNLIALKELSWSGVPNKMRAVTWRLLSGYLPTSLERRNSVLERKRLDYHNLVAQYFRVENRDEGQQDTYRQIHIDVPRMNPHVQLFQQNLVQEMFERILFIWAIRHPASGYVQGINDLVTPFFIIFLQEALVSSNFLFNFSLLMLLTVFVFSFETANDLDSFKIEDLSEEQRNIIEADSFWCLSKFLDCIQDNYIFAQLGIQAKVNQLKELIQRIDGKLIIVTIVNCIVTFNCLPRSFINFVLLTYGHQ